ncbi:MAG: LysR family transcriptional regulator [Clostridium sp.]|nr:LysR family transcriptional regulator [Clostridium sp.]
MRISRYEILMKVIELGSLTKTARYFNYTQSAVSQIINSLEDDLGLSILTRNRSGVWLTAEGKQLLPYIRTISNSHIKLSEKVFELLGMEAGLIRIGTFSSVSCHWLPTLIKGFKTMYPNIKFELLQGDYSEIESWISDGVVDFGFVRLPSIKNFETISLKKDRMMVILSKDHPYANKAFSPVEALADEPFILLETGSNEEILQIFKDYKITPNIHYRAKDDYTIMSMVENGLGISILSELVLTRNPYKILVKEIHPAFYRTLGIALKSKENSSLAVKYFIDYITDNI